MVNTWGRAWRPMFPRSSNNKPLNNYIIMTRQEVENQIREILPSVITVTFEPLRGAYDRRYITITCVKLSANTLLSLCKLIGDKCPLISTSKDGYVNLFFITNIITEW